jgi:glycosyltransferase involved in cell wall biosynthesis
LVSSRQGVRTRAPRISVVVPALNEAPNLPYVFEALPADLFEVLLVDGASVDGTVEVARRLRPDGRLVRQSRRGKGNALACGFAAARGDIIVTLDADGSADPGEIPRFVAALTAGADFAKGTRFGAGGGSADLTLVRRAGNRMLTGLVNAVFGTRSTDLCYGFNAFWVHCLDRLELDADSAPGSGAPADRVGLRWGDGFEFETLVNVRVTVAGLRVREVASFEGKRLHGVSHLDVVSDGLRVVATILRERRRVRRSWPSGEERPRWEKRTVVGSGVPAAVGGGRPCQAGPRSPW